MSVGPPVDVSSKLAVRRVAARRSVGENSTSGERPRQSISVVDNDS